MGLDMYLYAERAVAAYDFSRYDERALYFTVLREAEAESFVDKNTPIGYVRFCVGYWRKANAIHDWFVRTVQGGIDDCRDHHAERDQLTELRDTCQSVLDSSKLVEGEVHSGTIYIPGEKEGVDEFQPGYVIENTGQAQELLPTRSGFFFGSTDYDQYYYQTLVSTIRQIDRALTAPGEWAFYYHASW